jgi:hypothetical protein
MNWYMALGLALLLWALWGVWIVRHDDPVTGWLR